MRIKEKFQWLLFGECYIIVSDTFSNFIFCSIVLVNLGVKQTIQKQNDGVASSAGAMLLWLWRHAMPLWHLNTYFEVAQCMNTSWISIQFGSPTSPSPFPKSEIDRGWHKWYGNFTIICGKCISDCIDVAVYWSTPPRICKASITVHFYTIQLWVPVSLNKISVSHSSLVEK